MTHRWQKDVHMSEEDLELLITLDDPVVAQDDDTFSHPQAQDTFEYWLGDRLLDT